MKKSRVLLLKSRENEIMEIVRKNKYGFYELRVKPSNEELEQYYAKKYYQEESSRSYAHSYSNDELQYFNNKIERKYRIISQLIDQKQDSRSMLDIGCGEGFTLKFFKDLNWEITGLDFSDYGCRLMNPEVLSHLIKGDIYQNVDHLLKEKIQYCLVR